MSWHPEKLHRVSQDMIKTDYCYLKEESCCYYFGEYMAGEGDSNEVNQFIYNYKKPPSHKYKYPHAYKYKQEAIVRTTKALVDCFSQFLDTDIRTILVPTPGSKNKNHSEYDDRNLLTLKQTTSGLEKLGFEIETQEAIINTKSRTASHSTRNRPSLEELQTTLVLSEDLVYASKEEAILVVLFDDVLARGAHFITSCNLIKQWLPSAEVVGVFIARTIHEEPFGISLL